METETTYLHDQITAVERNVTTLTVEVAVLSNTVATKQDIAEITANIARIDATLAFLQENSATKADLYKLETRITKWMIATLVGVAALNSTMMLIVVKLLQP